MNLFKLSDKDKQHGAALIFIALMLAMLVTVFSVSSYNSLNLKSKIDLKTGEALKEAKTAILGWSVKAATPGQLPCPEDITQIGLPSEGEVQTFCPLGAVGRLPWKSLGVGDLRDGRGDRLWYAISSGFGPNPIATPINTTTLAQLSVDGIPNSAVAIVFSVGAPLSGQNRVAPTNTLPPDVVQYLDLENNNNDNSYITSGNPDVFNDKLLIISHSELFNLVSKRILGQIRGDSTLTEGLVNYYSINGNYPYADTIGNGYADTATPAYTGNPSYQGGGDNIFFGPTTQDMLVNNEWLPLVSYILDSNRQNVTLTLNGISIGVMP